MGSQRQNGVAGRGQVAPKGRLRILLAESSAPNATPLAEAFGGSECDLVIDNVASFDEALLALDTKGYDCVVVESALADFDTLAAAMARRGHGIGTPLILVVENDDLSRSRLFLEAGAADCVFRDEVACNRLGLRVWKAVHAHQSLHQLAASQQSLSARLMHDDVTRLPNRTLFFDRLEKAVALARRGHSPVALLLLDFKDFNQINRTFGHAIGDRLLEEAAARLVTGMRESDTLARVGDNEFAILLPTGATPSGVATAASKLREVLQRTFTIGQHRLLVLPAIGAAIYPLHATTSSELMRAAESALWEAKSEARGFAVYARGESDENREKLKLASQLRQAIDRGELRLHYQPKIDIGRGRVCGAEALVRWQHPRHGLLSPDNFVPLAEQIGLIGDLTNWVLNVALQQTSDWHRRGFDLSVSVNLSPLSLHNRDLAPLVESLLEKWGVPPSRLVLEITESAIISHMMRASEILRRLYELGVGIAIDDFGTGYTSLSYLRKLPVSELKIDKSFVTNMCRANDDAVIVRTIIELAKNLGLKTVAEGVEEGETWQALSRLGCEIAQGYYMSRPVEPQALERWLMESAWSLADRELPLSSHSALPASSAVLPRLTIAQA